MNENIATIREFLQRGELRLMRNNTMFQIVSLDKNGVAEAIQNPITSRQGVTITLTEKELAELASICFPAKKKSEDTHE